MATAKRIPCALTIAGSDSGGGAGIQADLKTMAALGVHGTSAITCITAQNPKEVRGIQACTPEIVRQQIEAVFAELRPAAVKTGMLYSNSIIRVVASALSVAKKTPVIVDPVMVATSGAQLLKSEAIKSLCHFLLPQATLVTPNLEEAEILVARKLRTVEDLLSAAREINGRYGCAALLKGGHLRRLTQAVDVFFDGETELLLSAPFVRNVSTHGTGCTYSAAIAAYMANGLSMVQSVQRAKDYITQAIRGSVAIGKHSALNCFAAPSESSAASA